MVDIELKTSLNPASQSKIAESYLSGHPSLSFSVAKITHAPDTLHVAGVYELLDLTLKNHDILTVFMTGFALSAGASVARLAGKVFDSAVGELGKDLYRLTKDSLLNAIQKSKDQDSGLPVDERLGSIRFVLHGNVLDRLPFFAYQTFDYAKLHSDVVLHDRTDWAEEKLEDLFSLILPFLTYLLKSSDIISTRCSADSSLHMSVDSADADYSDRWLIALCGLGYFGLSRRIPIDVEKIYRPENRHALNESYKNFVDAIRPE